MQTIIPYYSKLQEIQKGWPHRVAIHKKRRCDKIVEKLNDYMSKYATLLRVNDLRLPTAELSTLRKTCSEQHASDEAQVFTLCVLDCQDAPSGFLVPSSTRYSSYDP